MAKKKEEKVKKAKLKAGSKVRFSGSCGKDCECGKAWAPEMNKYAGKVMLVKKTLMKKCACKRKMFKVVKQLHPAGPFRFCLCYTDAATQEKFE